MVLPTTVFRTTNSNKTILLFHVCCQWGAYDQTFLQFQLLHWSCDLSLIIRTEYHHITQHCNNNPINPKILWRHFFSFCAHTGLYFISQTKKHQFSAITQKRAIPQTWQVGTFMENNSKCNQVFTSRGYINLNTLGQFLYSSLFICQNVDLNRQSEDLPSAWVKTRKKQPRRDRPRKGTRLQADMMPTAMTLTCLLLSGTCARVCVFVHTHTHLTTHSNVRQWLSQIQEKKSNCEIVPFFISVD